MGKRMTREEFLEAVFSRRYEELKGRELRTVRVRVVGKELSLAQLIGVTDRRVYENLGLHIGTHLGEDHTGQSIGLLHLTPWEATVVAADVPMVRNWMVNSGCERIFEVSNLTREGIQELLDYLQEDPVRLTLEQAKARQRLGLTEWEDASRFGLA